MFNENIIGFNKTVIKYQLMYFLKDQYETTLIEVTNAKNSDGLSGVDKMAMNLSKVDEGVVTMAEINISKTIDMIRKIIDVPITEEELDYYDKYADPSPIQIQLVNLYYTKFFGTYRDLTLLPRREYLTLSLILKKKLLIENGYEIEDQTKVRKATVLPYILTGKLEDKVNTRIIRNNKFVSKIEESYLYQHLIQNKYKYLEQIRPKFIIQLLSSFINTKFSYITYENEELLGKEIKYSDDKIGDELLFFLYTI